MTSPANFFPIVPSWDLFVIIGFFAAVFIYGWSVGKNRLFAILISTYFSYTIVQVVPWEKLPLDIRSNSTLSNYEIFLFFAIMLALLFLLPQSSFGSTLRLHKRVHGRWYEIFILSILQIGLLICLIVSFLPNKMVLDLNLLVRKYFTGEIMKFIWFSLPIVALVLMGRRREE